MRKPCQIHKLKARAAAVLQGNKASADGAGWEESSCQASNLPMHAVPTHAVVRRHACCIGTGLEDVSEEARGVPAIYERASALSRNRESLDECMSRLYSLTHENPDVTYDDFTYKRILQACTTYANAPIATRDHSMQLNMQLDKQLAALADALATLETDLCVP